MLLGPHKLRPTFFIGLGGSGGRVVDVLARRLATDPGFSRFADLVPFYAADRGTSALLIIGEIGGAEEEEFAQAVQKQDFPKPVYALIAGRSAPEGVTMGHAGALVHGSHGTYAAKRAALEAAGVTVFSSLNEMVEGIGTTMR